MLEWAGVDDGARPKMLGRHDDPVQEYAYRPRAACRTTRSARYPMPVPYTR
jgi:hypothetical protein